MWDAFELELTDLLCPGASAELLLRVEKPASPTGGPDAPAVPGRFPLRETLAGFLPYVWGHSFGGIGQPARLRSSGPAHLLDACARGAPDGQVEVACVQCGPGPLRLTLLDPDATVVHQETLDPSPPQDGRPEAEDLSSCAPLRLCGGPAAQRLAAAVFTARLPDPRPWDPERPEHYTARLELAGGELRELRFGLRALRAEGAALLLNGRPIYPRMLLSWGWYPGRLCPDPGPARVCADLLRLKELGYNGVKLCLWFPPPYYFEIADEPGLLLWVELPLWLPRPSAHMRRQLPLEYARLTRQARRHPIGPFASFAAEPSVVVATLWTEELADWVARGGAAVLLQSHGAPGPFATARLPFWREALKLAEPHLAWGDFPTDEVGVQFFACAPDCALATAGAPVQPLLRRIDTRSAAVHDYAAVCAWGAGRLIVSTLRPEGGLGDQPLGLARSPAASHMLAGWVRYLARG